MLLHGDKDWWGIIGSLLIAHHLESKLLASSLFTDVLCYSLEFVFPQVRIIYFVSEGHKAGWLVCCFWSIYSVGSRILGLPQEITMFILPALPISHGSWSVGLLISIICTFTTLHSRYTLSLALVLMGWLCSSSLPVTQTCQLTHKRYWVNYLKSYL